MTLTPEQAKTIVEKISSAEAVFAERGAIKGKDHLNKAYRYKFSNPPLRHIAIMRKGRKEGITVYVNQYSVDKSIFSNITVNKVNVLEKYAKGHEGKTGYAGIAGSVARLSSLNPQKNDVIRLLVSSEDGLHQLLVWYLGLSSLDKTIFGERQDQILADSLVEKETSDLSASIIPQHEQDDFATGTQHLNTDERKAIVKIRYGQGSFRDVLIGIAGEKCWMTGLQGKALLIASHIKPWSHCNTDIESRGHRDNGLLLSALWDSAFDAGLISFNKNWSVICCSQLSESAKQILDIQNHFELPIQFRNSKRAAFLDYHRTKIFNQ